jgi:hypothetical protein
MPNLRCTHRALLAEKSSSPTLPSVSPPIRQLLLGRQSEPPFLIAQVVVMALFIVLGIFAVRKFHVEQLGTTEVFG